MLQRVGGACPFIYIHHTVSTGEEKFLVGARGQKTTLENSQLCVSISLVKGTVICLSVDIALAAARAPARCCCCTTALPETGREMTTTTTSTTTRKRACSPRLRYTEKRKRGLRDIPCLACQETPREPAGAKTKREVPG